MLRSFSSGYLFGAVVNAIPQPWSAPRGWSLPRFRPGTSGAAPTTARRKPSWKRTRRYAWRTLVPASMAVVLALVIGLVVFRLLFADRIYPAVVIGDVPVGGLTVAEAQARLMERAAALEQGTITFAYGGQTWTPTLAELGVSVDLDASVAEARSLGRGGSATDRLAFLAEILDADQTVPLRTRIDPARLDAWYDRVDRQLGYSPVDATLALSAGTLSIAPSTDGLGVDREAATDVLVRALTNLEPVSATLPAEPLRPRIATEDLEPVRAQLAQVMDAPIVVTFEDQRWEIAPATLAPFLGVETVMEGGRPAGRLTVDTESLAPALREQFAPLVDRKPVDAELGWNNGLVVVTPATIGAVLEADAFAEAIADHLARGGERAVQIPVASTRPAIDGENLAAYGIDTLLGQGDSNFDGGVWERDENIRLGARLLNGTLVPPGGTFSFNGAVGAITYEAGFKEAEVIVNEQVGRDVGGGICQVSTTVFRAAILAGMPIAEWYPHSFRLETYERDGWAAGFDASILQLGSDPAGWSDFTFENYTDSWLLVESTVTYPNLYVSIYGSGDGRTVDLEQWPLGGNAFAFTRVIRDAQGAVVAERTFESYYK